jgi:DNA polymerase III epsilon subunit-like protein
MDMGKLKAEGEPFAEAVREFIQWCGTDCRFCTWGSMDLMELQRNMEFYGVEIPFERPLYYYDVQKLYGITAKDGKEKLSLDHAVEELGIEQSRPFHQALDDAYYTGMVLRHMKADVWQPYISMDYYWVPTAPEEQVTLKFPTYSKFVSRTFETKEDALADKVVSDVVCPLPADASKKNAVVFPESEAVFLPGSLPGPWVCPGEDTHEESGKRKDLCCKDHESHR